MKLNRTQYNTVVMTPKASKIKKTCPRDSDGYIKLCSMGEVGERAVAQTLRNIFTGKQDDPLPDGLSHWTGDHIPFTTQQLVELGRLSPEDEKTVQLMGVDIFIGSSLTLTTTGKFIVQDFIDNPDRCIQVKLQPFATNYKSITVETCVDHKHEYKKPLNSGTHSFEPSGVNKTIAKWTAYIVSGGTIIFIETDKLRESINGKERKYQGTAWGKTKDYAYSKRVVGSTANILSLLQTGVAYAVTLDTVFRAYLSSLTHVEDDPSNYKEYSWNLFIQDWAPSTLVKFLGSGMVALTEEEVNGSKNTY